MTSLFLNTCFYSVDNITHIVVGNIRAGRQTDSDLEKGLADTMDIGGRFFVGRVFMYWFPKWSSLDVGLVKINS